MGSFGAWHWLIIAALLFLAGYPVARILNRLGFSRWWVLVAMLPYLNVLGLWVLAFVTWPVERR